MSKHICLSGPGFLYLKKPKKNPYSPMCINEASKLGSKGNITVLEQEQSSILWGFCVYRCVYVKIQIYHKIRYFRIKKKIMHYQKISSII